MKLDRYTLRAHGLQVILAVLVVFMAVSYGPAIVHDVGALFRP